MSDARMICACRSCGSGALSLVLDLGQHPIANALLEPDDLAAEPTYPLGVAMCAACGLAQVTQTIPPEALFAEDYPYFSSFSPALLAHSREHAQLLVAERKLGPDDFVVEIASNDGYLLRNFVEAGVPSLGIDPAAGPAQAAIAAGVPTLQAFFNRDVAARLLAERGRANVMLANNVLAHVEDINAFVAGFATLLHEDGIAEFEFPYVRDLIERCAFDTVYHEHVFYFSLSALEPLFARHALHLNDATPLSIHGGSLRVRVSKTPVKSERLLAMQAEERALGLDRVDYYLEFGRRVLEVRENLRDMVTAYRAQGKRVAAYGAAAKGATLLNFVDLPEGAIEFVVDRNTHKIGKLMPGVRLPILDVAALQERRPDVLLILAWNFADEIVQQQRRFAEAGGVFVSPIPCPRVISE